MDGWMMDGWMIDGWMIDGWMMDGWMYVLCITLQGRGDAVGQSEAPADPGTDSGAVEGAATLMGPEGAAGLRTGQGVRGQEGGQDLVSSGSRGPGLFRVM